MGFCFAVVDAGAFGEFVSRSCSSFSGEFVHA